ncbi:MAG: hypothetical protein MRY21_02295 [Simkaniaceae bacterium]|nr:hypothetical protein [Simkaniaceae bacterium]
MPCPFFKEPPGSGLLFTEWHAIYRMNFFDAIDKLIGVWDIPGGGLITSAFVGWRVHATLTNSSLTSRLNKEHGRLIHS